MQTRSSRIGSCLYLSVIFSSFCLFFLTTGALAQGNLMFYPKRIVFDGSKRSQDLSIANNGSDTARYVISVIQIRMNEDGSFETINEPDPGQHFADKNFRFYPRTVVLPPHEAQTVKVQLLQFGSLAPGEYRSHLYFRAEEEKKPLGNEKKTEESKAIAIEIHPIYGVSIPVIIRVGEADAETALSNIIFKFENQTIPVVNMNIDRTGSMSVYGDVTIHHISPEGKEQLVAQVKGLAVYAPNKTRLVKLALDKNLNIDYTKGALHIVFKDYAGSVIKIAQQQIYLR
jgi:hypothetical protein